MRAGKNEVKEILKADGIMRDFKTCPKIEEAQGTPCYSPKLDIVIIPVKEAFISSKAYFSASYSMN